MKSLRLVKLSLFVLLLASIGCSEEDDSVDCNFDQSAMLSNYADNLIVPAFLEMKSKAAALESSISTFTSTPDQTSLTEAQNSFVDAYIAYQGCSTYSIGPAMLNGLSFRERFNTYPADVAAIEANIINESIDVSSNGKATVGLPAIGFLLFGQIGNSSTDVLTSFEGSNGQLRKDYLVSLATGIFELANQIHADWVANYSASFVGNTGTAEGTSLGLMVNELSLDIEIRKNFGFKIPLGKFNGGMPLPEECEGYYAGISSELALAHNTALKNIFSGGSGSGLDDYLNCLEYPYEDGFLETAISDQFQAMESAFTIIPDPMSETLLSDYTVVNDAYSVISAIVPLTKREMPAALGVSITYQDSDGD